MWRSTGDIFDTWESIKDLMRQQEKLLPFNGVGCFNDMDMLVVGMHGKGNVGLQGCSDVQYKNHFSMWAFMGSPLMIGCDIRNMSKETLDILTNEEIIRINQDPVCRQPMKHVGVWGGDDLLFYSKLLAGGDIAIGLFNLGGGPVQARLNLDELGLPFSTGKTLELHELWTGEVSSVKNAILIKDIQPYDCAVLRAKVVDL